MTGGPPDGQGGRSLSGWPPGAPVILGVEAVPFAIAGALRWRGDDADRRCRRSSSATMR